MHQCWRPSIFNFGSRADPPKRRGSAALLILSFGKLPPNRAHYLVRQLPIAITRGECGNSVSVVFVCLMLAIDRLHVQHHSLMEYLNPHI
jgi:hypothetical protein